CALATYGANGNATAPAARCRNCRRGNLTTFPPNRYCRTSADAPAADGFQIGNARQPLALTLPFKSNGIRHGPPAARTRTYIRWLIQKTGQCRFVANRRHVPYRGNAPALIFGYDGRSKQ